jgi:hypothetical protein
MGNVCYITVMKFWTHNRYQWQINLAVTNGIQISPFAGENARFGAVLRVSEFLVQKHKTGSVLERRVKKFFF